MKRILWPAPLLLNEPTAEQPTSNLTRRNFLVTLGVLAIAISSKPLTVLADEHSPPQTLKRLISDLAYTTCDPSSAQRISQAIARAPVYGAPAPRTFHDSFSADFIIAARIYPTQTTTGRYFELDRYAFYDAANPCARIKDLNAMELSRITDCGEREFYRTVLSPCSERRQPSTWEDSDFQRTAIAYRSDPAEWTRDYSRSYTDGRRSYLAHGVTSRRRRLPSGAPAREVLLSPEAF